MEEKIPAHEVKTFIDRQGGELLQFVDIFDVYSGEKVEKGKKSIAFRLKFQSKERTLKDKEVDKVFKKIITKSEQHFNASLRDK